MEENFDFQQAVSKIQEMFSSDEGKAQLEGIMDMFRDDTPSDEKPQESEGFDPSMLLKMQKLLSMNSKGADSDQAKLLRSIKPFLKEERKGKVDKAIQLMNMSKIISIFKDGL